MSTATIAGKLAKLMEPAPTVKELDSIDGGTRGAVRGFAIAEAEMPGTMNPPAWLRDWMEAHAAELFIQPADPRETRDVEEEVAADEVFSRDEDQPEEEKEDTELLDVEFAPEAEMSDEELEKWHEQVEVSGMTCAGFGAATVTQLRAGVLGNSGSAGDTEGLAGAIWRARRAVVATDYLEGAEMTEDAKRGFAYKATRDAFEALRIIWAAEGLHVVPVEEAPKAKSFREMTGGRDANAPFDYAVITLAVAWEIEHLPSGEKSGRIVTSGVGVGRVDEAMQTAKTMARKQMLCDAFGVQIHTQDMDTEARKR